MDADRIERRLRRLDAAASRTERRAASLAAVHDHHAGNVFGAMVDAEASREQFIMAARVAFRDPYRALKVWERHEWRVANLTLESRDEVDVAAGAQSAIESSKGHTGLTLRGRTRLGRDDGERLAAREAFSGMAAARASWLLALRRARTFSQAKEQVGRQVDQLQNRLRSIRLRRSELLEQLHGLERSSPEPQARPSANSELQQHRPSLGPHESVATALTLRNATRRRERLDRAATRYLDSLKGFNPGGPPTAREESLERRLAAYKTRRSELTATIVRAEKRLPQGIEITDEAYADLKELHRAYAAFVDERQREARYPAHFSPREREHLDAMERRAARLEKGMERYSQRIAVLSDPEFDIPEKGDRDSAHQIRDPEKRQGALSSAQRRLNRAELRHRALRESLAAQALLLRHPQELDVRRENEAIPDRETRAERERRRLARLYHKERSRADSLELGR